jgi:putative ABC transport system permease protein
MINRALWRWLTEFGGLNMQTLLQDIRFGVRMLVQKPGFAVVAVLTLALGIGANTAIFTVINGVLMKPLPFRESDRLMSVWSTDMRRAEAKEWVSALDLGDWLAQSRSFERMAGWFEIDHTLTDGDEPMRLTCVWVTADFFPMLGAAPMLGRFFEPAEFKVAQPQSVIISHALWRDRFGSARDLPGKNISINEKSYTVVGVMPLGFQFPSQADEIEVWMPNPEIAAGPYGARDVRLLTVAGRLKPNITLRQAQAEMDVITAALRAEHPKTNQFTGARLIPAVEELTGGFRRPLLVLLGAVGCVLLIACVNVAGLLLARGASRQREMAVRAALGGSRCRIIRQLLTESLILACVGGGLGVLLAAWGVDALVALSPTELPGREAIGLDGRVLAFTLSLSLLTGVLFGLAPAWSASKVDLTTSLKDGARGTTDGSTGRRLRGALVVAEIALALVLLAGAGLLVKSFWRLRQVDPGFDPRNVLTLRLSLDGYKYKKQAEWADWFRHLQERLKTIPGVIEASVVMPTPMHGVTMFDDFVFPFEIEGRPLEKSENARISGYNIQPGYFRTMGIRLVAGRDFTERDDSNAPAVIIISEEFVRRYFPNENPLGKRMRMLGLFAGPNPRWREIVGVAADVKGSRLNAAAKPEVYTAHAQDPFNEVYVALKTSVDPRSVVNAVRAEVQSLHKYQAFYDVKTLSERLDASVAQQRFSMLLLTLFAALALILTAVGLYGVMAYTVAQRTHEIGVRMALGAQTRDVLKLVLKQGMMLALAGVVIGLIASFALTRLIERLLFGVSATDPVTFAAIAALLTTVALVACYIPARRAAKVDPMVALKCE